MILSNNNDSIPVPGTNISRRDSYDKIEKEISALEKELQTIDTGIRTLQAQIHNRYQSEIARIHTLSSLHKCQRKNKQEKRREQKKRGKNYKEPLPRQNDTSPKKCVTHHPDHHIMKQLYREAIVQVHPDKFVNSPEAKCKRSQELTIQLIDIYQKGDIEQLKLFHRYILSGSAMSLSPETELDIHAKKQLLEKKRDELLQAITEAKSSRFYKVITTYTDPLKFIDELSAYFSQRIAQLEKRTRMNKKNMTNDT
jgi:hypothetical protein